MEIPSKQPQCSWPAHADMLTEKDERIQLWKPDRHRRSDSSIPHPKDAVTKTSHSSSSDRSAPGWATLGKQNPVPWLTAAAPGPGSPWTGAFSRGSTRLLGDNSCSRHQPFLLCSQAQHCPCPAQLCSSLASVLTRDGLHRQAGGIPGQGYNWDSNPSPKGTGTKQQHSPVPPARSPLVGSAEPGAGCAPPCA